MALGDDDPEIEDYAPVPGLTQALPVVVPLSQRKLGLQNVRPPHEVHAQLCENELRDDEWAFKRDRAQAALSREQQTVTGLRLRAEQAERNADAAAVQCANRVVEIQKSVDERRRCADDTERALTVRVRETKLIAEETERECAGRIEEARALLEIERAHTAELEALLSKERQRSEAGRRRVEQFEANSQARLAARDGEVEREQAEAQERVDAARAVGDRRVREAEERAATDLQAMRDQLDMVKRRCGQRVELEAKRNAELEEEGRRRRDVAAARLNTEQVCMKQLVYNRQEDCGRHVQRVRKREDETRAFVEEWKDGAVAELHSAATARSRATHRQELCSNTSLAHSLHILGQHYGTQRRYTETVDGRISNILKGCLHSDDPALRDGAASPSPRSLGPPGELSPLPGRSGGERGSGE